MTFPINTGIPSANNDPADDQPLIQQNFSNINGYLNVDHVLPGASGNGYHKQSTYTALGTKPYAIPFGNNGAAYTKLVSGVAQLFFENSALAETQLTFPISVASPGYAYLPGGVLVQWGSATAAPDSTTVTFPIAFNTLFSCVVSHSAPGAAENTAAIISAANKTTTGFLFRVSGSSGASYSYVAIGN